MDSYYPEAWSGRPRARVKRSTATDLCVHGSLSAYNIYTAASLEETGYIELLKLVDVIRAAGQEVLVVDSDDLQVSPFIRVACLQTDL